MGHFSSDLFESNTFYLNIYFLMRVERKTPYLIRTLSVSGLPALKVLAGEYYKRAPHLCQGLSCTAASTLPLGRKQDEWCTHYGYTMTRTSTLGAECVRPRLSLKETARVSREENTEPLALYPFPFPPSESTRA